MFVALEPISKTPDSMQPIIICRTSLAACAAVGMCLMLIGVVLVPTLPHFQLDSVLTAEQLADAPTRDATLALLKRANGNLWLLWFAAGLITTSCAVVGLLASRRVG